MPKRKARVVDTSSSESAVSIRQWMLLQFLIIIPLVGFGTVLVMAFAGDNRTRKNFFRALVLWALLFVSLHFLLFFAFLSAPTLNQWTAELTQWFRDLWRAIVDIFPKSK